MKQKTKWFVTSLMLVMFCLQATAQPEGKFYLYNSAKAFLSRAANGNATVDKFGIPVEVKKSDSGCSLMFLDNGRYVAPSGSTVKGDVTSAAYATITADGDNYTVALKEGEFLGVDGSNGALAVKADASASGFNAKWQLLTQAERDVIVADMELAQIEAVAKAAGITLAVGTDKMTQFIEALKAFSSEDATDLITNPTLATSQDGWTVNVLAGNNNIDYKSQYAMTLYQNTALEISQFLEVPNGIYKATIQNTYRSSKRETLTAYSLSEDHLSICNAYFAANENQAQAVEWSKIRTSATLPYSRGDFENFTTNSKYTTTVWAYVNDGKLTLKYVVPSINNSGGDYDLDWFTFANVKLTRYFQPSETTEEFNLYDEIVTQSSDPSAYNAVKQAFMDDFAKGTMTEEEVTAAKATLKAELFKMMKTVPALFGQYDITSFVTNPKLDSNIKGWKSSPLNSFKVANKLVESFGTRTAASFSQVISDMPAGEYTLKVQGFYRNGEWKQALANYERGKDNVKAAIYVDDVANKQPLKSIFADGCYMSLLERDGCHSCS